MVRVIGSMIFTYCHTSVKLSLNENLILSQISLLQYAYIYRDNVAEIYVKLHARAAPAIPKPIYVTNKYDTGICRRALPITIPIVTLILPI